MAEQYKYNIYDIIDRWEGYPAQKQIDCQSPVSGDTDYIPPSPAENIGNVGVKCFINRTCPFFDTTLSDYNLVFNKATMAGVIPDSSSVLRHSLSVSNELDGIYLAYRKVFRHNYIFALSWIAGYGAEKFSDITSLPISKYREISEVYPYITGASQSASQTRYKEEQSWAVYPSVFFEPGRESIKANWAYRDALMEDSEITLEDVALDYTQESFKEYSDSLKQYQGNPEVCDRIKSLLLQSKLHVQFPVQTRVQDHDGQPIHWRVCKMTPIFEGEDFFIRFTPQARFSSAAIDGETPSFKDTSYSFLDVTSEETVKMDSRDISYVPVNQAVTQGFSNMPDAQAFHNPEKTIFNFWNQPYYIIEMGVGRKYEDRYFIIITSRANPMFVHLVPNRKGKQAVSRVLSVFEEVSGKALMDLRYFDIVVRNHAGSLVIKFEGPGLSDLEWVVQGSSVSYEFVEKEERNISEDGKEIVTSKVFSKENVQKRVLSTPRGQIMLWGGCRPVGFSFGPLQSRDSYVSLEIPPSGNFKGVRPYDAFESDEALEDLYSPENTVSSFSLSLPSVKNKQISFSSSVSQVYDIPVQSQRQKYSYNPRIFVHDAQYYKDYHFSENNSQWEYGSFYYGPTVREFSQDYKNFCKTSNIALRVTNQRPSPDAPLTSFRAIMGLMSGDHVFVQKGLGKVDLRVRKSGAAANSSDYSYSYVAKNLPNNVWLLPGCKTPVVSSIKLYAHSGTETRWDDGTSSLDGIPPSPEGSGSPYLIDASQNVMSYSENWAASGFSELDHKGTISFYLNKMKDSSFGVTDDLESLRDKAFYIEVWAGYRNDCSYTKMEGYYKLFTGVCFGGSISKEYNKDIMTCQIEDYSSALRGTAFFNSPWFDGMKHEYAIKEILDMCGFRDVEGSHDPGSTLKEVSDGRYDNNEGSNVILTHSTGRIGYLDHYILPSGYSRLENGLFKANDGDYFFDMVQKIVKLSGSVFYFDPNGVAVLENFQDSLLGYVIDDYQKSQESNGNGEEGTNPNNFASGINHTFQFTTNPEFHGGQLVFNKVETGYDVANIANHIKIMSSTPDQKLLILDSINWRSLDDPNFPGFLGFKKSAFQQEGLFGNEQTVRSTMKRYEIMFLPKKNVKFETFGVPLMANDMIKLDGETLRVVNVEHSLVADKKQWTMNVECMMYGIKEQ